MEATLAPEPTWIGSVPPEVLEAAVASARFWYTRSAKFALCDL